MSLDHLTMTMWGKALEATLPGTTDRETLDARKRQVADLAAAFGRIVEAIAPDFCLEIGAHEASFSTGVKRALPQTHVVAFEANADVHARHADSLAAIGIDYRHQCVTATPGEVTFMVPVAGKRAATKMGSILPEASNRPSQSQTVEGTTLDAWCGDRTGSMVVWIDVEGAVGHVIDGGARALDQCVCLFAEVESESRWTGQMLDGEVIERLAAHGLRPVARDAQRTWQYNVLFLREELAEREDIAALLLEYAAASCRAFDAVAAPAAPGGLADTRRGLRQIGKLARRLEIDLGGSA